MLQDADAMPEPRYSAIPAPVIAALATSMTRRAWVMRDRKCLRQGLIGYRFLRKAGYMPELHFGISPDSLAKPKISAHCWVELDGLAVIGQSLEGMVTIHVHGSPDTHRSV